MSKMLLVTVRRDDSPQGKVDELFWHIANGTGDQFLCLRVGQRLHSKAHQRDLVLTRPRPPKRK